MESDLSYQIDNEGLVDRRPFKKPSEAVQIEAAKKWISERCSMRKTINRKSTSYGIKHTMEYDIGVYVGNGAFLEAAKQLGYRIEPDNRYKALNGFLNMNFPKNSECRYIQTPIEERISKDQRNP